MVPNPARGHARVAYSLASRAPVDLAVYSVDGRRVKTLARGVQEPGRYEYRWNGVDERGTAMARASTSSGSTPPGTTRRGSWHSSGDMKRP
jgi:hypothetical protein